MILTVSIWMARHLDAVKIISPDLGKGRELPTKKETYHHGDLRNALLAAAESVLAETGPEAFSLRAVARRVGVSHSAPAHHFGDTAGLLDALATEGFRRFLAAMEAEQAVAGDDPKERLIGSGMGYVRFAESAPALLQLMFGPGRKPDEASPELQQAAGASFAHLVDACRALPGAESRPEAELWADVYARWSLVHGLANLLMSGRLKTAPEGTGLDREAFVHSIVRRIAT